MTEFALCARGNLTRDEVHELVVNRGDYAMETKHDGIRCIINKVGVNVVLKTRNGFLSTEHLLHIVSAAQKVPAASGSAKLILDGELILPGFSFRELQSAVAGGPLASSVEYVAFDLLSGPSVPDMTPLNYLLRHRMLLDLDTHWTGRPIRVVDQRFEDDAMDYYDLSKAGNLEEGFVLKKKSSVYTPGATLDWLRSKFTNTISVMPFDVREDGRVLCGVYTGNGNQQIVVATVQVPGDDLVLMLMRDLNVVIELEAFGVDERNTTLRHPVYKGCRFDTDMLSCTSDQLETLRSF